MLVGARGVARGGVPGSLRGGDPGAAGQSAPAAAQGGDGPMAIIGAMEMLSHFFLFLFFLDSLK